MATQLTDIAYERGSVVIELTFYDQVGTAVTPETLFWTLTDGNGTVINDRAAEEVETPTNPYSVRLGDTDLTVLESEDLDSSPRVMRKLHVHGTYTYDEIEYKFAGEARFWLEKDPFPSVTIEPDSYEMALSFTGPDIEEAE